MPAQLEHAAAAARCRELAAQPLDLEVVAQRRHQCRQIQFLLDPAGLGPLGALVVPSEEKAKMDARRMAALGTYEGVIAWSRTADLVNGVFGDPVVIFQHGTIPDME